MGAMTNVPHSPGLHYLLELSGVKPALLTDAELLEMTLEGCARRGGATVVKSMIHEFSPHGLSGVVVISESHIAVHTWPELDYVALDIFTCGAGDIAEAIYQEALGAFSPKNHIVRRLNRGPVTDVSSGDDGARLLGTV